jgi:hypothetical protein
MNPNVPEQILPILEVLLSFFMTEQPKSPKNSALFFE